MTQTLQRFLDSAGRQVRSDTEDVRAWAGAADVDVVATGKALAGIMARVIAGYAGLEEVDRLFREAAGNRRPNPEAAVRAEIASREFAEYAVLGESLLRSVADLPPDHRPPDAQLAELKRLRDAAAEMASVYRGEAQYFGGAPFARWEDVRKQLGV
jgi:hypothetical protein